jgi:hypothetical protein
VRNKYNAGYHGSTVGPQDKNKAVLWWMYPLDQYRVFYGDLRTEVLTLEKWVPLVPPETSESHLPADERTKDSR